MRYVISHGHIFKNAGSTFDSALKNAFGRDFCDHRDDKAMRQGGAKYLKQFILDNPNLKAISSHHLCNPLPVSECFVCIPVYFVRNPIERIISVYNFERKQKPQASLGAEMASKLSLIEYVRWRMSDDAPKVISNYQTAYIGATKRMWPAARVSSAIFKKAIRRVLSGDVLVGTVERFDESFNFISNQLRQYFPGVEFSYKKKNISNNKKTGDKYTHALEELKPVLPEVITNNAFDLSLCEIINQELDKANDS